MWEIQEVLRRLGRGESQVVVGAATGLGRKTIRRYQRLARDLGWTAGAGEPEEALVLRILEQTRPGPKAPEPGPSEGLLLSWQAQIQAWLSGTPEGGTAPFRGTPDDARGLTLTKVRRLLQRQGVEVPYSSLHRFAVQHCEFGKKVVTVRCAPTRPGEVSQIDFGRLGYVFDPETGRRRLLWALIVILIYSRHMYVHVTRTQKLDEVIDGLEAAWEFFDGVTARCIVDNLKSAIIKADRYEPDFQRTFAEYAGHRGFIIDPAAAYHPKGKPHVERQVPYVRENFFRGEQWLNAEHVQREAIRWCLETAGPRDHGTTHQSPLVVFEQEEKAALLPLQGVRFDTPHWADCSVHPDHHVQFRKALYSVPTAFRRKKVLVRGDRSLVRIYFQGQLIKTHPVERPGGRSTDYDDYPKELAVYARRDPDYMIAEAHKLGATIGRFTESLLGGDFPWSKLRQAQKLLRLARKYGPARLEQACATALAFELINVRRVEDILLRVLRQPALETPGRIIPLPARFLRPPGSFAPQPLTTKEVTTDGDQTLTQSSPETTETLGHAGHAPGSCRLCPESQAEPGGLPGTHPAG
jgi:hypothetical protein